MTGTPATRPRDFMALFAALEALTAGMNAIEGLQSPAISTTHLTAADLHADDAYDPGTPEAAALTRILASVRAEAAALATIPSTVIPVSAGDDAAPQETPAGPVREYLQQLARHFNVTLDGEWGGDAIELLKHQMAIYGVDTDAGLEGDRETPS